MILYHGTNMSIPAPDINLGKVGKDFGNGFYLSDTQEQAEEFAKHMCNDYYTTWTPYVNAYEFDETILNSEDLKVLIFEDYCEEWVDYVYEHRKLKEKCLSDYDIIYGPIADGDMKGSFLLYEAHKITKQQLLERLKYHKGKTFQYYFGTPKALQYITFYCSYKLYKPNTIAAFSKYKRPLLNEINWEYDAYIRIIGDTHLEVQHNTQWVENNTIDVSLELVEEQQDISHKKILKPSELKKKMKCLKNPQLLTKK